MQYSKATGRDDKGEAGRSTGAAADAVRIYDQAFCGQSIGARCGKWLDLLKQMVPTLAALFGRRATSAITDSISAADWIGAAVTSTDNMEPAALIAGTK